MLCVVLLTVGESRKSAYADNVAERSHHGNRFQEVFTLIAVHNYATLGFQFPSALIYVKHNDVKTQVARRLLRRKACAKTIVEKHKECRFSLTEIFESVTVVFNYFCQGKRVREVAKVFSVKECLHIMF